jgi:hypothetical protein
VTAQIIQLSIAGMTNRQMSSPAQYRKDLIKRTEACRIASELSREEVVFALAEKTGQKLKAETYKKWELRTPIPHFFLIPFCEIVGADPWFLLTGKPFKLGKIPSLFSSVGELKRGAG